MNKFDAFLINSKGDLTGSYVVASRPVGVISGNKKASVGHTEKSLDGDATPCTGLGEEFCHSSGPREKRRGSVSVCRERR